MKQWSADNSSPSTPPPPSAPLPRPAVAAISADRYLLKVTLSKDCHSKLERARVLLRHVIPNGDPAAIVDRALTVLIEQLERTKLAATPRPRATPQASVARRRVPAAVRRAAWRRDDGRCAFVGTDGRCPETGFLECHHVIPFARGDR
jgi:5-methylcytosine-specific restriction endonuclease McrA